MFSKIFCNWHFWLLCIVEVFSAGTYILQDIRNHNRQPRTKHSTCPRSVSDVENLSSKISGQPSRVHQTKQQDIYMLTACFAERSIFHDMYTYPIWWITAIVLKWQLEIWNIGNQYKSRGIYQNICISGRQSISLNHCNLFLVTWI